MSTSKKLSCSITVTMIKRLLGPRGNRFNFDTRIITFLMRSQKFGGKRRQVNVQGGDYAFARGLQQSNREENILIVCTR